MVYILTSSGNILDVEVRLQESRVGDSAISVNMALALKSKLSNEVFTEQQFYLTTASIAAYIALNKIDQRNRFKASVNLKSKSSDSLNFIKGSSSSGLGYSLALFNSIWTTALKKGNGISSPVFASGEIGNNGGLTAIKCLNEKLSSVVDFTQKHQIGKFYLCIPEDNEALIPEHLYKTVVESGGEIISSSSLPEMIEKLVGDEYDGDPLNRWEPFKGLKSFEYEDSIRFFGRKKDVKRLYDDIERNRGILIVSGSTGSGKSSLIKAGLIPILARSKENFHWESITPTSLNYSLLETILYGLYANLDSNQTEEKINELLKGIHSDRNLLIENLVWDIDQTDKNFLFHIDQFEDFFTQDIDNKYLGDLQFIHALTKSTEHLKIVLSIRNEYLAILLDSGLIASPVISNVSENLPVEAWREIVIEQATFSGVEFEKEPENLAERIINDASQTANALPMVEFVLAQLYERAKNEGPNSHCLKMKDYEEIGGITGAIAKRAEEAVIKTKASPKTIHHFFSLFVGVTNEGIPYPQQIIFNKSSFEKNPDLQKLIQSLIDSNIVANVVLSDQTRVKLIHDSLFNHWESLKSWLEDQASFLEWKNSIDRNFKRWEQDECSKQYLISDTILLKEGVNFIEGETVLDQSLKNYVLSSRRVKRTKTSLLISSFLAIVFFSGIFYWDFNRIKVEYHSSIAEKWGVPVGIHEVTEEELKHRTGTYKLVYQRGLLRSLSYINGQNKLIPDLSREGFAKWQFDYDEKGYLSTVFNLDSYERPAQKNTYEFSQDYQKAIVRFNKEFGLGQSLTNTLSVYNKSLLVKLPIGVPEFKNNIYQALIKFNQSGCEVVKAYQNELGDETLYKGIFSKKRSECSSEGMVKQISYLDKSGEQSTNLNGETKQEFFYNSDNAIDSVTLQYLDKGFFQKRIFYDEFGNIVGKAIHTDKGEVLAKKEIKLDEHGRIIQEVFNFPFFGDNTPSNLVKQRFYKYEDHWPNPLIQVLNTAGKEVIIDQNILDDFYTLMGVTDNAKLSPVIQFWSIISLLSNKGLSGVESASNCNNFQRGFDDSGRIILLSCLDFDGKNTSLFSALPIKQVNFDYKTKSIFLKLFLGEGKKSFDIELVHDKKGNSIEIAFSGEAQGTIFSDLIIKNKFDDYGNKIEQTLWRDGGSKKSSIGEVFLIKTKFDQYSRKIESSFFDQNGNPIESIGGIHKELNFYALNGNILLSRRYYDKEGKIILLGGEIDFKFTPAKNDLLVKSIPIGAKVFIDGKFKGVTPLWVKKNLVNQQIVLKKDGYFDKKSRLDLEPENHILQKVEISSIQLEGEVSADYIIAILSFITDADLPILQKRKSLELLKKFDQQNNSLASNYLSQLYRDGVEGLIDRDITKARAFLLKAVKLGNAEAEGILAFEYLFEGGLVNLDIVQGEKFLKSALEKSDPNSMGIMANYLQSQNKPSDDFVPLYEKSCLLGIRVSCWFLGKGYYFGDWGEQNDKKSAFWLELAKSSFKKSYVFLAEILLNDSGESKTELKGNLSKAYDYALTAYQSEPTAMSASLLALASSMMSNYGESVRWERKAIELAKKSKNYNPSWNYSNLAHSLLASQGTTHDLHAAFQNLKSSKELGLIQQRAISLFTLHLQNILDRSEGQ